MSPFELVLSSFQVVQGLNAPGNKRTRAEFNTEAEEIAARAGADVMSTLTAEVLPKKKVTLDNLLLHPEWALVIGRYGDAEQIRHLKDIDADLCRSGCQGGRRLGFLIDEAFALSGQLEAAVRKSGRLRTGWIFRHVFSSPYKSCIPEGTMIGPDGTGSAQTSEGPMALSMTPEFRLRYTDPVDGKVAGTVPEWLFIQPGDRRLRDAFAVTQRYLTALRQELQDLLEQTYLLGETMPGQWLTKIAEDPLIARYFRYVVFRQADKDFMLMPGGFITSDGSAFTPHPNFLVNVPHPLEMDGDTLAAFRAVPKRGYAKVPQLREPAYDMTELPNIVPTYNAQIIAEDGRAVLAVRSTRFVPHGVRKACKAYSTNSFYPSYRFPVRAGDRLVNHILYQMDSASVPDRLKQDDLSLLPLLRADNPKRALRDAIKAGAAAVTAALLEETSGTPACGTEDFRI